MCVIQFNAREVFARVCIVGIISGALLAGATPASAKSSRQCKTVANVGRNCITVTKAGSRAFRVRVGWTYDEARNVGFETPVKRASGKRISSAIPM